MVEGVEADTTAYPHSPCGGAQHDVRPRFQETNTMNIKSIGTRAGIATSGTLLCVACAGASPGGSESTVSASEALATVQSCQAQAFACAADAQAPSAAVACNTDLRDCLISLLPDAGSLPAPGLPTPPSFDAGLPRPPVPSFDAGLPRPVLPPLPTLPSLDAGLLLPPLPTFPSFDAGLPRPPLPPVSFDAGLPTQAGCLTSLQSCMLAGASSTTCAADAQTCLAGVVKAQCDAQEQACVAAGVPQTICTQQRQACH
jgi:hypothetical protein